MTSIAFATQHSTFEGGLEGQKVKITRESESESEREGKKMGKEKRVSAFTDVNECMLVQPW